MTATAIEEEAEFEGTLWGIAGDQRWHCVAQPNETPRPLHFACGGIQAGPSERVHAAKGTTPDRRELCLACLEKLGLV